MMSHEANHSIINDSILMKRWKKFKTLKRGYYSLIILSSLYGISFLLPFLINNKALIVKYNGDYYFPVISGYISGEKFGQDVPGEANYRSLKAEFLSSDQQEDWVWMPPYPYSPYEDITLREIKCMILPLENIGSGLIIPAEMCLLDYVMLLIFQSLLHWY